MAEAHPGLETNGAHETPTPQPQSPSNDLDASPTPMANYPAKRKSRQRLLRGISRISSSPSLAQLGRSRAASVPYGSRPSLSCVSLISPATPDTPISSHAYPSSPSSPGTYSTAPSSRPASPGVETTTAEGIEGVLGIRKVERDSQCRLPTTGTAALPQDLVVAAPYRRRTPALRWSLIPIEIKVHVLSFLISKELVRVSCVSKDFYRLCFDGQLWTRLDASEFYNEIPPDSLTKLVQATGSFIRDLNLRGCIQIEKASRAEAIVSACHNLVNANLEGCKNLQKTALHSLLRMNERLTTINLTGLGAATNKTCYIIADHCPQLQSLNVSWCKQLDTQGLIAVVCGCRLLRDLRAGEVRGLASAQFARTLFQTNRLERLTLCGCEDLTDAALKTIVHGTDPEIDFMTDRPLVEPRKLRHLDLSRCSRVSNQGIKALAHFVPHLEGLQLNRCTSITNEGLTPLVATTPRLTHLELEDIGTLNDSFLAQSLSKAPCAPVLQHLSVGYCENVGDIGLVSVIKNCRKLASVVMDNTRISNATLRAAVETVKCRSPRTLQPGYFPPVGLRMDVYDCQNITWAAVVDVLSHNADMKSTTSPLTEKASLSYPTEVIALKCFYGWQMTVDEHMKRVQRCDFSSASRLCVKWKEYMQATEEAGVSGTGLRRRRRRAREAQQVHADEESGTGRRRARTLGSCVVM
ncbi:putative f-box domain protein [Zalerion maritima]|uniref:F-box domain protein n=1 Tax=Zalerion maritima TaxID=339359 RepID=A0AAD5RN50_9PEZI|nr:putative f-box domain protein [Zalerion maritima]